MPRRRGALGRALGAGLQSTGNLLVDLVFQRANADRREQAQRALQEDRFAQEDKVARRNLAQQESDLSQSQLDDLVAGTIPDRTRPQRAALAFEDLTADGNIPTQGEADIAAQRFFPGTVLGDSGTPSQEGVVGPPGRFESNLQHVLGAPAALESQRVAQAPVSFIEELQDGDLKAQAVNILGENVGNPRDIERSLEDQVTRERALSGASAAGGIDAEIGPEGQALRDLETQQSGDVARASRLGQITADSSPEGRQLAEFEQALRSDAAMEQWRQQQEPIGGALGLDPELARVASTMAGQYVQQSETFFDGQNAYRRLVPLGERVLAGDSGVSALSMVFTYAKTLDPNSQVTEGEQAAIGNTSGKFANAWNLYNRVRAGEVLPPETVRDMLATARVSYEASVEEQQQLNDLFTQRAEATGIPGFMVVRDIIKPPGQQTVAERLLAR